MQIQFDCVFLLEQLEVFDESLHRNRRRRLQTIEDHYEYPLMYDQPPQRYAYSALGLHPRTPNRSHVGDWLDCPEHVYCTGKSSLTVYRLVF